MGESLVMLLPRLGTEALIDEAIVRLHDDKRESYLGFSQIGETCERKLFYGLHYPEKVTDPRILRIFRLGHILETEVIKLLRDAGLTVYDLDENGKQFEAGYFNNQFRGHPDLIITGLPESSVPHLGEIKTYNSKRFATLKKDGVKSSDYKYYAQLQVNMAAFDLTRALLIAYNKDTSEIYCERVDYDPFDAAILTSKAGRILDYKKEEDAPKAYHEANYFTCKMCSYRKRCWELQSE